MSTLIGRRASPPRLSRLYSLLGGFAPLSSLDRETVRRVAEHARLSLTDEELDRFAGQLGVVMGAFAELDRVDTEGVEPSYQPVAIEDVSRGDEPEPWEWDPFANSRSVEGRHLRGPRIT